MTQSSHPGDYPPYEYGLQTRMELADKHDWWKPTEPAMAVVYLNHGRWVAECPKCRQGEHWDSNMGHWDVLIGGRFQYYGGLSAHHFRCSNCYLQCRAVWPEQREAIWDITKQRPVPQTRNWLPGETVDDLRRENEEHGVAA